MTKEEKKIYNKEYNRNPFNKARKKERDSRRCKEKLRNDVKEWRLKNLERDRLRKAEWYIKNKEHVKETRRKWLQENKKKAVSYVAKRRAVKLQQTPKWADLRAIEEFYLNCPDGYTVDHIIPLKGKNVRGLHVLENLQYLTKSENSKKGNKLWT